MSIKKKISAIVERQLPGFVRQDHPKFVAFLEAYYEWMAQDGNAEERLKTLLDNQDIDTTLDEFVDFFNKEFLVRIPQEILADRKELSKHIKEYYRARGTEKSYQLLFRILFDSDLEFYYPHVDILRASDGKWQQDIIIKVQAIQGKGDPGTFESHTIIGRTSQASAIVDKIVKYYVGPYEIYELYLNRSSMLGNFVPNENVYSKDLVGTEARVYPIITGIDVTFPGTGGYTTGQLISITGGSGLGASAEINAVDDMGQITSVRMLNFGVGYDVAPVVVFPPASPVATGEAIIGAVARPSGYYLNQDGHISSSKRIQDSYFYQQFSYVLYVEESIEKYREIVKQLIHPAGLILFGGIRSVNQVNLETQVAGVGASFIRIERTSQPQYPLDPARIDYRSFIDKGIYHGNTVVGASEIMNGRVNTGSHASGLLRTDIRLEEVIREGTTVFKLGPSLRSFERDKFKALPSENSEDATPMLGVNLNYWDQYGNQQIEHFENWVIQDFEFFAYRRINIMPDPVLKSDL
jgi:hypothetical protein